MLLDSKWIGVLRNVFDVQGNTKRLTNLYHTFDPTHGLVPHIQNNEYYYGL